MKLSDQWKGLKSVPTGALDVVDPTPSTTPDPTPAIPPMAPVTPPGPLWKIRGTKLRLWKAACQELERMGTLQRADARVIMAYVEYTREWMRLSQAIDKNGSVVETEYGRRVAPEVSARRMIETSLRSIEADLGFGPASRARMLYSKHGSRAMSDAPQASASPAKVPGRRGGYAKKPGGASK